MSFSKQVKEELNALPIKSNCCKKSYIFGALLGSSHFNDSITITLSDPTTADKLAFFLKTIYRCESNVSEIKRGCFKSYTISFKSSKLADFLSFADGFISGGSFDEIFTCPGCRAAFLRAVFCAMGSVSDPKKSFTLELRVPNDGRASLILDVIAKWDISTPSRVKRDNAIGLFYRRESSIEDFITVCGANKSLFSFFEASVEKNLRNDENRATNCVARNILKSVEATALHISAIEALRATSFFDDLPSEIKQSAILRLDNPNMSLSELAAMHNPPISKSGLNHRLSKIIDEAKKRNLI